MFVSIVGRTELHKTLVACFLSCQRKEEVPNATRGLSCSVMTMLPTSECSVCIRVSVTSDIKQYEVSEMNVDCKLLTAVP